MFVKGFNKIASGDEGWHILESLLSQLPAPKTLKAGDKVTYTPRIKWTNEPDGRHTGGGWDKADFHKDGVTMGAVGEVVSADKRSAMVKWNKHTKRCDPKDWTHRYNFTELRKVGDYA